MIQIEIIATNKSFVRKLYFKNYSYLYTHHIKSIKIRFIRFLSKYVILLLND